MLNMFSYNWEANHYVWQYLYIHCGRCTSEWLVSFWTVASLQKNWG